MGWGRPGRRRYSMEYPLPSPACIGACKRTAAIEVPAREGGLRGGTPLGAVLTARHAHPPTIRLPALRLLAGALAFATFLPVAHRLFFLCVARASACGAACHSVRALSGVAIRRWLLAGLCWRCAISGLGLSLARRPEVAAAFGVQAAGNGNELIQRHGAEVLVRAQPHGHRARLLLLIANHQHIGNLLKLGVAYLGVHALFTHIHLGA